MRGTRTYAMSAAALVCTLTGSLTGDSGRTLRSADLPGPAYHAMAGPVTAPSLTQIKPWKPTLPGGAVATPGRFELVGHSPLLARGMNAALAVHGDYAYVGSRTDGSHLNAGVMVVDLRDPRAPKVVGQIARPYEANVGESSRELRVIPEAGLLLVLNHGCSELLHVCVNATQAGLNIVKSSVRFYDIRGANAAAPKLVSTYRPTRTEAADTARVLHLERSGTSRPRADLRDVALKRRQWQGRPLRRRRVTRARRRVPRDRVVEDDDRQPRSRQPAALADPQRRRHAAPSSPISAVASSSPTRATSRSIARRPRCAWSPRWPTACSGAIRARTPPCSCPVANGS